MKIIGLDVGTVRIGVARVDTTTKIAIPDGYINVNEKIIIRKAKLMPSLLPSFCRTL